RRCARPRILFPKSCGRACGCGLSRHALALFRRREGAPELRDLRVCGLVQRPRQTLLKFVQRQVLRVARQQGLRVAIVLAVGSEVLRVKGVFQFQPDLVVEARLVFLSLALEPAAQAFLDSQSEGVAIGWLAGHGASPGNRRGTTEDNIGPNRMTSQVTLT